MNYLNSKTMKEHVDNIKAAGARARKAALNLMKMMKDFRKESVEATK